MCAMAKEGTVRYSDVDFTNSIGNDTNTNTDKHYESRRTPPKIYGKQFERIRGIFDRVSLLNDNSEACLEHFGVAPRLSRRREGQLARAAWKE